MTLVRCLSSFLLLAALPGALAAQGASGAPGSQGLAYSMAVAIDSGSHKTSMAIRVQVLGSRFRMSTTMDTPSGARLNTYMLIDSAASTITTVMPEQATAMVSSSSMLNDLSAARYTWDFAGVPRIDIVDLGAGEPILGHATRHYRETEAYVTRITIGADVCTNPENGVTDFWVTGEIKAPDMAAAMRRFFPGTARGPLVQKLDSIRNAKIKGVILRQVATGSIAVAGGDAIRIRSSWELTELKPGSVDPKDFEIPQGYRVTNMREMDPGMLKRAQATTQANRNARMKKQFCGATGAGKP
jgi:hypothetical protein